MEGKTHTGDSQSQPWIGLRSKDICTVMTINPQLFFRNMDIQDRKSCTVLTYVRQIKSSVKDELLQIILEYRTQSGKIRFFPKNNANKVVFQAIHNSTFLIPGRTSLEVYLLTRSILWVVFLKTVSAHVVPEFHFPAERCNNPHSLSSPHPFSTLTNVSEGKISVHIATKFEYFIK